MEKAMSENEQNKEDSEDLQRVAELLPQTWPESFKEDVLAQLASVDSTLNAIWEIGREMGRAGSNYYTMKEIDDATKWYSMRYQKAEDELKPESEQQAKIVRLQIELQRWKQFCGLAMAATGHTNMAWDSEQLVSDVWNARVEHDIRQRQSIVTIERRLDATQDRTVSAVSTADENGASTRTIVVDRAVVVHVSTEGQDSCHVTFMTSPITELSLSCTSEEAEELSDLMCASPSVPGLYLRIEYDSVSMRLLDYVGHYEYQSAEVQPPIKKDVDDD